MASDKAKVNFVIGAQDAASAVIKKVNSSVGGLKKGVGAVGTGMGKLALAGGVAVGVIAAGIGVATKAAADEEKGIARLNAAVKANVKSRTDMAKVEELITKRQETLAFSDGELRDSMAALLPFTKNISTAYKWQGVAADLARTKNIGLEEASLMVAKTMGGSTKLFKQLGIVMPATAKKIGATTDSLKGLKKGGKATAAQIAKLAKAMTPAQKKAAKIAEAAKRSARQALVLAAIQGKVAGQAKAYAKGTEGQFTSLKNSFDDVVEDLGKEFLPIASDIAKWAKKDLLPAIKKALPYIADFAHGFINVAAGVADKLQPVVENIVGFVLEKVVPALQEFAKWVNDNVVPALQEFAKWVNDNVVPALQNFAGWVKDEVVPRLQEFAGWVNDKVVPALREIAGWINDNVVPALQQFAGWVKDKVLPAIGEFGTWLQENRTVLSFFAGAILGLVVALQVYAAVTAVVATVTKGVAVVTKAWAAFQLALNVALAANPLGLILLALVALAAGLAAAYASSEDFRKIVDEVFKVVGDVAGVVGNVLVGAFEGLKSIIDEVAKLFGQFIDLVANSPLVKIASSIAGIVGDVASALFGGSKPVPIAATAGSAGLVRGNWRIPASQVTTNVTLDGKKIAQSIDVRLGQTRGASNPQRGDG